MRVPSPASTSSVIRRPRSPGCTGSRPRSPSTGSVGAGKTGRGSPSTTDAGGRRSPGRSFTPGERTRTDGRCPPACSTTSPTSRTTTGSRSSSTMPTVSASAEIAELVGCSLATAKIRVHRARRRLRETLAAACSFEIDDRGVLVCDPQPLAVRDAPQRADDAGDAGRLESRPN